jgi:hypothetical protein
MISLIRFRDLKARGIVNNWPSLKNLVEKAGFPPGRMLSSNCRTWTEEEVDEWYRNRPVEGPAPRGAAKQRRGRPRKNIASTTANADTIA